MKKLLVTLTVMGIMVGALATLSSAASKVNSKKQAIDITDHTIMISAWQMLLSRGLMLILL